MSSVFDLLSPDVILEGLEKAGYFPTGEIRQLNSYENRVFDLRLESDLKAISPLERVIAKFYRPNRWTANAIEDEHEFLQDLQGEGIPAIAPLTLKNGKTLLQQGPFLMALFPKALGRMPQEFLTGDLKKVGRTLARIHNVGSRKKFQHRQVMDAETYGYRSLPVIEKYIYPELWSRYENAALTILDYLDEELDESSFIRIHGDCHRGNLLEREGEFFFVDFDDCCMGPEVQDFWMLLGGNAQDEHSQQQRDEICEGYEELREIPDHWHLLEPLRGLRIIMYAGWIGTRWDDSYFQRLFPQYTTYNYWLEEIEQLQRISDVL